MHGHMDVKFLSKSLLINVAWIVLINAATMHFDFYKSVEFQLAPFIPFFRWTFHLAEANLIYTWFREQIQHSKRRGP
jgi:hypothetical protein